MYNRVFKNNQVTYGRPYQINVPLNSHNFNNIDDDAEENEPEQYAPADPEELLNMARQKCEMLINEANIESERLLEQARIKAEKEAADIVEEAWQRGYAEGLEAAAKQNRTVLEEAESIRQNAAEEYENIIAGMEADILELVIKVAKKAVAGELESNRDVILQLVSSALAECSNKEGAIVRVSPADGEYLAENMDRLAAVAAGADRIEIRPDSTMKPGDCIIETPLGSIDAGAGTRLAKIEEAMREEYEGI